MENVSGVKKKSKWKERPVWKKVESFDYLALDEEIRL